MSLTRMVVFAVTMMAGLGSMAMAAEPSPEVIKATAGRALALIEASTKEYLLHRDCFSCHHQAVPVLALTLARDRGFSIDSANIDAQLDLTVSDLEGAAQEYRKGRGQPGGVTRAGYALLALAAGGWKPDDTTASVAEYLVRWDRDSGRWRTLTQTRPPSEDSDFTSTFLALDALKVYGTDKQRDRIADRITRAKQWLAKTEPEHTEDRVFRLWALKRAEAEDTLIHAAAETLRAAQRDDGGWSQLDGRPSDAYATGSALVALHRAGGLATADAIYQRGLAFLIKTQRPDGSWHIASRAHAFQPYFESGFPHGKDQFISMAGSAWATSALVLALPVAPGPATIPPEP
jgi:hypothetical protein